MGRFVAVGATFFLASALAMPLSAQVAVGKGGVVVKDDDGTTVKVGKKGVVVKDADTTVKVRGKSVEIKGDGGKARIKAKRRHDLRAWKKGTVRCRGTEDVAVSGRAIRAPVAVEVAGACDVSVKDSAIEAGRIGAHVRGSGDLHLSGVTLQSKEKGIVVTGAGDVYLDGVTLEAPIAFEIKGAGTVHVKNSTIRGKRRLLGAGEIQDLGGNTFEESE